MADRLAGTVTRDVIPEPGTVAPELCRRLRWKTMFMALAPPDPDVPFDPQHEIDDGFVWCTHSMNCLGPDGAVASRGACREGRSCFERAGRNPVQPSSRNVGPRTGQNQGDLPT